MCLVIRAKQSESIATIADLPSEVAAIYQKETQLRTTSPLATKTLRVTKQPDGLYDLSPRYAPGLYVYPYVRRYAGTEWFHIWALPTRQQVKIHTSVRSRYTSVVMLMGLHSTLLDKGTVEHAVKVARADADEIVRGYQTQLKTIVVPIDITALGNDVVSDSLIVYVPAPLTKLVATTGPELNSNEDYELSRFWIDVTGDMTHPSPHLTQKEFETTLYIQVPPGVRKVCNDTARCDRNGLTYTLAAPDEYCKQKGGETK